jgi:hypothetical protein
MDRTLFKHYVRDPHSVPQDAAKELESVVEQFPWFQAARVLLARSMKNGNQIRYPEVLKDAALHTGNRSLLFKLLNQESTEEPHTETNLPANTVPEPEFADTQAPFTRIPVPDKPPLIGNPVPELASTGESITPVPAPIAPVHTKDPQPEFVSPPESFPAIDSAEKPFQIAPAPEETPVKEAPAVSLQFGQAEAISQKKDNPFEQQVPDKTTDTFSGWLLRFKLSGANESPIVKDRSLKEPVSETVGSSAEDVALTSLIDTFIKTEPRIGKPEKRDFFSPINMAKKSAEDKNEIVSETLAKLYADQGNLEKAVDAYKKLSLLNPAKSTYFAALIEKLENPSPL